ncbi:MAG: hypothetical protein WBG92_14835 [Thiohalocapsa sp.]
MAEMNRLKGDPQRVETLEVLGSRFDRMQHDIAGEFPARLSLAIAEVLARKYRSTDMICDAGPRLLRLLAH